MHTQVKTLQADVEKNAEEGDVDKSEESMSEMQKLLEEKEKLELSHQNDPMWAKERGQEICLVCTHVRIRVYIYIYISACNVYGTNESAQEFFGLTVLYWCIFT
jgi:hypothetical protein